MKIKRYVARDYKSAIRQAKEEMGRDAIILQTRQIKRNGMLGWFTAPQVEITVAMDDSLQVHTDRIRKQPGSSRPAAETVIKIDENAASVNERELIEEIKRMNDLMGDMRTRLYEVENIKGLCEAVQVFYGSLTENRVKREIAMQIAVSVESRLPRSNGVDSRWAKEVCLHTLREYVQDISPIKLDGKKKGNLVFIVGPTGVGKTTTIAKLAANMTFLDGKSTALITLDTYRISAAEQLRTFADIMGIPISVVFTVAEMREAVNKYREKDIVFVDTAGRSPYNDEQMDELSQYVNIAQPDETILVMSVTTDSNDLIDIYHQFEDIGIDKLIFTKLDETSTYGQMLNAIYEIKKPIAYLTTGQNVPDDIEIPDSLSLARMFLGKEGVQ